MYMLAQQSAPSWYAPASLAVSHLAPLITYFAVRPYVASDTAGLAIAWCVPVLWTLCSSLWLRRLDLFALVGVVTYGIALAIAIFFGGGALPLKLRHAVVAAVLGLACLVSVAVNKPLLMVVARWRASIDRERGSLLTAAIADPKVVRWVTALTLIIGIAALADATLQTVLALALSTSAFLIATTALHFATIAVVLLVWLLVYWLKYRA
jgi:hypothetical protein